MTITTAMAMIGTMVRDARARRGWSQSDLATALGVHRASVCRLEDGRCEVSDETLARVAVLLGLDVDALLLAAGRLPSDVADYLCANPEAVRRLRAQMRAA